MNDCTKCNANASGILSKPKNLAVEDEKVTFRVKDADQFRTLTSARTG
jgi:hypothetical protein